MYEVTFVDNTKFIGGSIEDSKWNLIPDNPIEKIVYYVGQKFCLSGFEKYNHLVTKVITINPKTNQKAIAYTELFLMGLRQNMVYTIIIDLNTRQVRRDAKYFGHEYNNRETTGWKIGSADKKCQIGRIN